MADYSNFTDRPIRTSEDFRVICDNARKACLDLADALLFAARVTKVQLIKYEKAKAKAEARKKKGDGAKFVMPNILAWRSRAVARVFVRASTYLRSAAKVCDKAYRVYLKHYAGDISAQQARARRSA